MMKFLAVLLLSVVLLFNLAQAQDDKHDHPHDVGADCPCVATLEYRPICASNGVTYSNLKTFECAKKCLGRQDLEKVKDSHC